MSENELPEETQRNYRTPYTDKRKIPTIGKYREEQEARQERARAFEDRQTAGDEEQQSAPPARRLGAEDQGHGGHQEEERQQQQEGAGNDDDAPQDTSEAAVSSTDAKQRMKERKKKRDDAAEREVTDPVTHLPVRIRDYTNEALEQVPENQEHYGSTPRTATGLSNKSKSAKELDEETSHLRKERAEMQSFFPPPDFDAVKQELMSIKNLGVTVEVVGIVVAVLLVYVVDRLLGSGILQQYNHSGWLMSSVRWLVLSLIGGGAIVALVLGVRAWTSKRVDAVWEDELWDANQKYHQKDNNGRDAESVAWLNSLLASVWPLVNPDLFTSLADTLEDGEWHRVS